MSAAARRRLLALAALALAALSSSTAPAGAATEFEKYALESVDTSLSTVQAGAHPDFTLFFALNRKEGAPYAFTRDVEVHLPPGFIGNPQGIPRCTVGQLGNEASQSHCPVSSQIGVSEVRVIAPVAKTLLEPIYNMPPPAGSDIVARFGLIVQEWPAFVNIRIDPTDYSIVSTLEGAPAAASLLEARTTIWGVPAAPAHDELRLTPEEGLHGELPKGGRPAGLPEAPFLSNPTDCSRQRQVTITVRSYQRPDLPSTKSAPLPQTTGCSKLDFSPRFTVTPTNPEASAPTGLDTELEIPQDETPNGLSTSTMKSAVVTLPEGMTINPSAADGLEACSAAEVGFGRNEAARCPDAAKIGSVEIDVPALEHTLHGSVFQRTPEPGRLFGFWLIADEQGAHLKLPAEITADPLTGQLTTVFAGIDTLGGLPQVPVANLKLHVFGGPRAPLATPASCGTYQTAYSFTPWSGRSAAAGRTAMHITSGCDKPGFSPGLVAGTLNNSGGKFSPFTFTLTRRDGEPNPRSIALHLPQGLLAKLAGVPLCPESAVASGACPSGSRIGSLTAAVGVGGAPLWIPQPGKAPTAVYLSGPYKGAPYSIISVVPAQAGPFDLGTVVNRALIQVDPETALATISTEPLPQILEGVPVAYRTIHVDVDRKDFTLNPTDCSKKQITVAVTASGGTRAEVSDAFQATNCAKLPYKPKLKLRFEGSTKRTGNPAVSAVLTQKPHQANTAGASVILPAGEFIDQAHINNPCTRVQFAANACPKKSILGHAKAVTPLLGRPLKGPVYFRSNGGDRELPDIVADLRGPFRIVLVGYVDSVRTGPETSRVRTRFLHVPDAPVSKFTMKFFGGKKGLVENSRDLCRSSRRAEVRFTGQNGRVRASSPVIGASCGKKRSK
jgi:hypothetical protein